ncbi:phosphatidylinositol kinase [Schizosaccharomyces japonicus yFS275]|uniref:1-phosphatidylinositol 4-kinase n=1 Tax=Schizosaccharomyces japonicus (strain yFS275 / FY16936) TaxID=402676 RepID=B6K734_SCHJY|nr:phosphatidylinositol kinase [Schizosaccharomyces japonicus yFS275]EEB09338.1 phosphatidylinositol kinase [Schizosaccharomyces japonicus yFS275]
MDCLSLPVRRESLVNLGLLKTKGWPLYKRICQQNLEYSSKEADLLRLYRVKDTVLSLSQLCSAASLSEEEANFLFKQLFRYLQLYLCISEATCLAFSLEESAQDSFFQNSLDCIPAILRGLLVLAKNYQNIAKNFSENADFLLEVICERFRAWLDDEIAETQSRRALASSFYATSLALFFRYSSETQFSPDNIYSIWLSQRSLAFLKEGLASRLASAFSDVFLVPIQEFDNCNLAVYLQLSATGALLHTCETFVSGSENYWDIKAHQQLPVSSDIHRDHISFVSTFAEGKLLGTSAFLEDPQMEHLFENCLLYKVFLLKLLVLSSNYLKALPSTALDWINTLLGMLTEDSDAVPHLIDCIGSIAVNFPSQLHAMIKRLRLIAIYAPRSTSSEVSFAKIAARKLAVLLSSSSSDLAVTCIYQFANLLSIGENKERALILASREQLPLDQQSSLSVSELPRANVQSSYLNTVEAVGEIALMVNDEKIYGLTISLLIQKFSRKLPAAVDAVIINVLGKLSVRANERDFSMLIQFYSLQSKQLVSAYDRDISLALYQSRCLIASNTEAMSVKRLDLLKCLLDEIIQIGVSQDYAKDEYADNKKRCISLTIQALSACVRNINYNELPTGDNFAAVFRNMWFALILNGFRYGTKPSEHLRLQLVTLAKYSPPLVLSVVGNNFGSDLELNTVLRTHIDHKTLSEIKHELSKEIPTLDFKGLESYEVCYLSTVLQLEALRSYSLGLHALLSYLSNIGLRNSNLHEHIVQIARHNLPIFVRSLSSKKFLTEEMIQEVQKLISLCCHRVRDVRSLALECCAYLFSELPSLLCVKQLLFTLLELLNILWRGSSEECLNQYVPQLEYTSKELNLTVVLPDSFETRQDILGVFLQKSKQWIMNSARLVPSELKNLLQSYLADFKDVDDVDNIEIGRSIAFEIGKAIPMSDTDASLVPSMGGWNSDSASEFISEFTVCQRYKNDSRYVVSKLLTNNDSISSVAKKVIDDTLTSLDKLEEECKDGHVSSDRLRDVLRRAAAQAVTEPLVTFAIIARKLVRIPFLAFSTKSIKLGITLWNWVMNEVPQQRAYIMNQIVRSWVSSLEQQKKGFFSGNRPKGPLELSMSYAPTDRSQFGKTLTRMKGQLVPHIMLLQVVSGNFESFWNSGRQIAMLIMHAMSFIMNQLNGLQSVHHPLCRELYLKILTFGLQISENVITTLIGSKFYHKCLDATLNWFSCSPLWAYGADNLQIASEISLMEALVTSLKSFTAHYTFKTETTAKQSLIIILLQNEIYRLYTWMTPVENERSLVKTRVVPPNFEKSAPITDEMLETAWSVSPTVVLYLPTRFKDADLRASVLKLIMKDTASCVRDSVGLKLLFEEYPSGRLPIDNRYLLFWAPLPPVSAPVLFLPKIKWNPLVLQYAMRTLKSYSVDVTFFYVPQIVQSLRYDALGYAEDFIIETSELSQLFAHQILWNMKANLYKDETATEPDGMKPILDRVMERMVNNLSGEDKDFYEREFTFFNEVTSISGKLKPFIKKPKPEKKAKIDEEMKKIKLDVGVYLPSNPDGIVVGIDRKSGKPLQSHAKAPFMATFKIQKEKIIDIDNAETEDLNEPSETKRKQSYEVWQSAIFKVGDDCRQDVLTLQLIAIFKNIFDSVGLDVYLFPYRVTATAPGCGVIDVLPNCVSRDMLGREAVNGLYDYFITKFGDEDSIAFQKARSNFVQSMAAYSVITYLLQFKDRHNGNIMISNQGHILHIDFGFIFDIAPGGITFESAPFKLTNEMIAVMGGNNKTPPFRRFQELCVKCFLVSRSYVNEICNAVEIMLGSGLPCFKGDITIAHIRERFALDLNERQAANFMLRLIEQSYANKRTVLYDQFQKATNGKNYYMAQVPPVFLMHTNAV